jgi:nitrous oxidase accessory protein NosD
MKTLICGLAALVFSAFLAPQALAQATRTWVSGVGDDANPCSRTAPCKTFAGAISKTASEGIIMVLDPGGFGSVTITKSITIEGNGSNAGIVAPGTDAININAAGITVVLRNLSIEGANTGFFAVDITQASRVLIEKCHIYGFRGANGAAIRMSGPGTLTVNDSTLHDNFLGVNINASSGAVLATFDNVRIEDSGGAGIAVSGAGYKFLNVRRSTINANAGAGVEVGASLAYVNLVDNLISFNGGAGVNITASGATARISDNTIVNNNNALTYVSGATIASDNTNRVVGGGALPNATFTHQ